MNNTQPARCKPRGLFHFHMPSSAPRPCSKCGVLVADGGTRCEAHKHVGRWGDERRGSRHERGYGTAWDKRRLRILKRDAGICQACLRDGVVHQGTEVDHIVPKARGGTDDDENLQTICREAHRAKTQAESAGGGVVPSPGPAPGPGARPRRPGA